MAVKQFIKHMQTRVLNIRFARFRRILSVTRFVKALHCAAPRFPGVP
jgi:hypothetical protein